MIDLCDDIPAESVITKVKVLRDVFYQLSSSL